MTLMTSMRSASGSSLRSDAAASTTTGDADRAARAGVSAIT